VRKGDALRKAIPVLYALFAMLLAWLLLCAVYR
jgi:hypothetical protein